ncbi:MAG: SMODS domain-containing nucleotidyltransferase [Pseudomonadota bacterium]
MKHITAFDDFLADTVNVNDTRLGQLDDSFEAIKRFIRGSDYEPRILSFYKHGSWAHRTIIKPVEGKAFDADVIVFVKPTEGWTAAQYVDDLLRVFRSSGVYKDKVRGYSHCATIEYAGVRKMDIAPCVVDRTAAHEYEVCNRISDNFEKSEPGLYTAWLRNQNTRTGRNNLRKVTRLLKYLRDIKLTFTCPSFLLTTLLGTQVLEGDRDGAGFADCPSALRTLVGRLDDWLQARPTVPVVPNPVMSSENQASAWTPTQYANFRNQVNRYRGWIDDAYVEEDAARSISKWQRVFGDEFSVVRKATTALEPAPAPAPTRDDVDIVRTTGLRGLAESILRPSWRRAPTWELDKIASRVTIKAHLIATAGRGLRVESGMSLESGQWIEFSSMLGGVPPGDAYRTEWRVTNTGPIATAKRALRGGFEPSAPADHKRREQLSYRGVHMVEAFVIRKFDQKLVGFSDPFYVVIE